MEVDRVSSESEYDASPFVPDSRALSRLASAARDCRGCPLYRYATQTVFGEGPRRAAIVLVGEQPGDQEDRAGRPFVGPAGQLLDGALAEAGLRREAVYVTNAVKHFKFEERGKRRLHKKPRAAEIEACRPWLAAELEALRPRVIVGLGVTARDSIARLGARSEKIVNTIHPSAALRAPDPRTRATLRARLVRDLRKARTAAGVAATREKPAAS
jgi:uracil-DNA glycosylase family protein